MTLKVHGRRIGVDNLRKSSIVAEINSQKEKKEMGWTSLRRELTEETTELNNKKFVTMLSYFVCYHH